MLHLLWQNLLKQGSMTAFCRSLYFHVSQILHGRQQFQKPTSLFPPLCVVFQDFLQLCTRYASCTALQFTVFALQTGIFIFHYRFPFSGTFSSLSSRKRVSTGALWVCWGFPGLGVYLLPFLNSSFFFDSFKRRIKSSHECSASCTALWALIWAFPSNVKAFLRGHAFSWFVCLHWFKMSYLNLLRNLTDTYSPC